MANMILLAARGLQAVLSIVILGLMAYVSSWWTSHWRQMSPPEVNWLVFSPVLSLIVIAAVTIIPMKAPRIAEARFAGLAMLLLEAFTMFSWLGGFIALAVFLGDRICFGTVCSVAKAGAAMSGLSWFVWLGTFVQGIIMLVKGRRAGAAVSQMKVEMHQGV